MHALPAGGYVAFPAGTPHRMWTAAETVLQMTGVGPRTYVYLNPQGKPEITALLVEVAPGAQTGWHHHLVPNFAYMLEGTLELTLDDGRVKLLKAGE